MSVTKKELRPAGFIPPPVIAMGLWVLATAAPCVADVVFEEVRLSNAPPTTLCLVKQTGAGLKHPVILTLGSLKQGELPEWSPNLLREGFMVVAFAAEYPPEPDPARRPVWLHFDPRFAHSYVLGGDRTPKDASRVIDYLLTRADVDGQRIGWLGSSTTGIFGLAAATREPRIKAIVAFVATGAYEKWLGTWRPNGLWQGDQPELWPETLALLPKADPIWRATNLFPCAVLQVNGGADKVVDLSSAQAFVDAARPAYQTDPDRLRLVVYEGMGHNLPRDVVRLYAEHWFGMYLSPSNGIPVAKAGPATLTESAGQTALTATPHEQLIGAGGSGGESLEALEPWHAFMPHPEDYTLLWWAEGSPADQNGSEAKASETLCLQSGRFGLAFDTRQIRLLRLGALPNPLSLAEAMKSGRDSLEDLPVATWDCAIIVAGHRFTCAGRQSPKDPFFQPVQVVESGHFFQRVVIQDLKFSNGAGHDFAGKARLEVIGWPDRFAFRLEVEPKESQAEGRIEMRVGEKQASTNMAPRTTLVLVGYGDEQHSRAVVEAESSLRVSYNEALGCHILALPEEAWSNASGTYYPKEHLDRLDRWRLKLRNDSDQETTARLMFNQQAHLPITGFTPLLCDTEGAPTGIPVQISKNWHRRPEKGALPHEGPWFHGCTFVRLPHHSTREFKFSMAYARYGGVFAASHAQLCLIGWGHNQFWDEAAIGSFGESICFEPGRVQRRCFIDDIRPLLTLPEAPDAKPYGWAGNCGGGDFLVWQDVQGRYRPFRRTRADYRAYGPCLTEVNYSEASPDGELTEQMTVSLPRSDDYLRTYIYLRYDVHQPLRFQRLAFFQLGADFYNETPSRRVAIGDIQGLGEEWEPKQAKDTFDRHAQSLPGREPWLSIHGLERGALNSGAAAASRGLVVRQWKATLGGKPNSTPCFSSWCSEQGKGNHRTVLELSPPPTITELQPGDFVEAELELVVFPAKPSAYYGSDNAFRSALENEADTWRLVHREAAGNALVVEPRRGKVLRSYPIAAAVDSDQTAEVDIIGGLGYVPVSFTGLGHPRGYSIWLDDQRVDQSVHGNDFWQTDFDPASRRWRLTYNLPITSSGKSHHKLRFALDSGR